jgi:hypothetical protein
LPQASRQDTSNRTSSRIALAPAYQALTTMLWLAELLVHSMWTATEGVVRFQAAMIAVGLNVVVVWRVIQRVLSRRCR